MKHLKLYESDETREKSLVEALEKMKDAENLFVYSSETDNIPWLVTKDMPERKMLEKAIEARIKRGSIVVGRNVKKPA